jgi:ZIP family zinc transporter
MPEVLQVILYSAFSGITVFLGGVLSYYFGRNFKEINEKRKLIIS